MISERLIAKLRSARSVTVFTGAGISAEGGVPTFRGENGLWKQFKPEELANIDAFLRNPDLVWQWYQHRKEVISSVRPNAGHEAIAAMDALYRSCVVITQNIDNLHQKAGNSPEKIFELHGTMNYASSAFDRARARRGALIVIGLDAQVSGGIGPQRSSVSMHVYSR